MLEEITADLGANYNSSDESVLQQYIDDLTAIALQISKQTSLNDSLTYLVKEAVKSSYLRRGDEGKSGSSEESLSSSYLDIQDKLRKDIINSDLRGIGGF